MEKYKTKRIEIARGNIILSRAIREGLLEKVTFEQRLAK